VAVHSPAPFTATTRLRSEKEDVFVIQDEIARSIARALRVMLTEGEKHEIEKMPTRNIQAYDYYLRGRQFFYQMTRKSLEFARQMFAVPSYWSRATPAGVTHNLPSTAKPDIIDLSRRGILNDFLAAGVPQNVTCETPSESSNYCGWSSPHALVHVFSTRAADKYSVSNARSADSLNVPVDMRCARNPGLGE
jgi:hypothetical protein